MGMDTPLSFFTADDYPGVGGRVLSADGVLANAALLLPVPEPDTALLLSLGLGGLIVLGRERKPA
jgi:hypothetical protein